MKRTLFRSIARAALASGSLAAALAAPGPILTSAAPPPGLLLSPVLAAPGAVGAEKTGRESVKAASRCFVPQGETIPAQKVMKDLSEGRDVDLQGRIVEGSLDADSLWPASSDDRKTSLRVMRGRLRLNSCRVTGRISLPRTVLMQDLDLNCTEILGDVDLTDTDVRGRFNGESTRFVGEVRLNRATVYGDTSLRGATIEDRVEVTGARLGLLAFEDADLKHDVDITRSIVDVLLASGARIGGAMHLQDVLLLRALTAGTAGFGRGFTAESVRVNGSLDLGGAGGVGETSTGEPALDEEGAPTVPSAFSLSDVDVDGQLLLTLAAGSALSLNEVRVKQSLVLLDGTFGEVSMSDVTVTGDSRFDGARFTDKVLLASSNFGKDFSASEAAFLGDVEMRRVVFVGDDPLEGAVFSRTPTVIDTVLPKPPTVVSDDDQDQNAEPEEEPPGGAQPPPPPR